MGERTQAGTARKARGRVCSIALALSSVQVFAADPAPARTTEREALLAAIQEQPGIHLRALQRRLGLGWGTLSYHLAVLVRSQAVHVVREGKHALVYADGSGPLPPVALLALRGAAARIFEDPTLHKAATQSDIQARLGISRQLVTYHLQRLETNGLVAGDDSRPRLYRVALTRSVP